MNLILNQNEFDHLKEVSLYNFNQYKHREHGYIILEECDENYDTYSFFLLENGNKIFLGDSDGGFAHGETTIKIDFKKQYT